MDQHRSWKPDVGYWAARWDPPGDHHPLIYTQRHGNQWVQVTSLPFVYAGLPLYKAAGTAGILLLPVFGSLLAAYAARRLAICLGSIGGGWWAFWVVGLGTPMLFYAGDFWEHSIAVGLALLALALAFEGGMARALLAGLVAGFAAVLRTEVLIYVAAVGVALLFVREERQAWFRRPARVVAAAGGLGAVVVANTLIERAVIGGGGLRSTRAGQNLTAAGAGLGRRLHDGAVTGVGLFADSRTGALLLGGVLVVALVLVARRALGRSDPTLRAMAGGGVAAALYAVRFASVGFVPGFFPAAPASAAGVAAPSVGRARALAVAAVVALPAVWLLQWTGQLVPQWGGRYVLLSGVLLTVVGVTALEARPRSAAVGALLAFALAVGAYGAVWHAQRTRGVARAITDLERVPRQVVTISTIAHLGREGGAWYGRNRWLNGGSATDTAAAATVASEANVGTIEVVELDEGRPPLVLAHWRETGQRFVPFLGFRLRVTRYTAA